MKRMMSLVLCLMLVMAASAAQAAAHYDTLNEKFARQVDKGSGLKGAISLTATGDAAWVDTLAPFSGKTFQLRSIKTDDCYQASIYQELEDGTQQAVTEIFGDQTKMYLRSDLLIDSVFSLPMHGDLLSSLTGIGLANPTWYSVVEGVGAVKDAEWRAKWEPALASYTELIERWMAPFAGAPAVNSGASGTEMEISYHIPAAEVKNVMKTLVQKLLADQPLMQLLGAQMTDEQRAIYLNPGLSWYYETLINGLPLEGEIELTHRLTPQGDMLYTSMLFPLVNAEGWKELRLEEADGTTGIMLSSDEKTLVLSMEPARGTTNSGSFAVIPAEGERLSVRYEISKAASDYTDDDARTHEVTDWTIRLEKLEAENAMDFEPVLIRGRVHYYSKAADNQATTLEVAVSAAIGSSELNLAGKFRTSSMWEIDAVYPAEGVKNMAEMTAEERMEVINDLFTNAMIVLGERAQNAEPTEIPEPAQEAAAAETTAETAEPEAEASEAPTETPAAEEAA